MDGRPTEVVSTTRDTSKVQLHQNTHCLKMKLRNSNANTKPNTEVRDAQKLCF